MFGHGIRAATSTRAADWIAAETRTVWWSVGALVPNVYERYAKVSAPHPSDDWCEAYRALFEAIGTAGRRHTTSERCSFAVWEGHGFEVVERRLAVRGPLDDEQRAALAARRAQLRAEDEARNARVAAGLRTIPRIDRPHRSHYLLHGALADVGSLRYPNSATEWRNPDLWWPDDRQWFVATDVDFWSLYIGGSAAFVEDVAASVATATTPVELDRQLEVED